jgi:hypothetical protein
VFLRVGQKNILEKRENLDFWTKKKVSKNGFCPKKRPKFGQNRVFGQCPNLWFKTIWTIKDKNDMRRVLFERDKGGVGSTPRGFAKTTTLGLRVNQSRGWDQGGIDRRHLCGH